jgi:signal transduction histidine kinase
MNEPKITVSEPFNGEILKSVQLLSEIGQNITSSFSIEAIIETTYDKVNGLMDASCFAIGIYNETEQKIDFPGVKEKGITLPFSANALSEERLSSICFNNQKEIIILEINDFGKYLANVPLVKVGEQPESIIYLPLTAKGNPIGVISVQSFAENAYAPYHLSVLKIIAAYVGTALDNARAYNLIESQKLEIEKKNQNLESEVQKRTSEIVLQKEELEGQRDEIQRAYRSIKLLSEIGQNITSSLTIEDIIAKVYENVNTLMDASALGIGIYNEHDRRIDFPGTIEKGEKLPLNSDSLDDERLSVWCFKNQKEIFIGDFATEYVKYMPALKIRAGEFTNSIIYLPLNIEDKKLGVLTVQSFRLYAYHNYHLTLLRNLAAYIAIAIENAEAYKKLNYTLETLKKTQVQLVQAEKMASLGQLTAGIAHEIQNPLNFVNNFSELNKEMIDEMEAELKNGNINSALAIASDIKKNEEKINHHGKRADGIVKGMLQHSRASSDTKEPVDINKLADEYLRLAYHGLRAKDKSFNAELDTNFDGALPLANAVPQDIGRVMLNLLTNAFYATQQKAKTDGPGYKPTVEVSTSANQGMIKIEVKDNGNGIPDNIKHKIFQPFFTTKPTGEGTGLGLSLGYDIVVKGHGGTISVNSKVGEGSEFIITLPVS